VVAEPSARFPSTCLRTGLVIVAGLACGEVGNLAISAGAPVMAAVQGTITDCGKPVAGAEVVLRVQQDRPEQARPVNSEIGPITTERDSSGVRPGTPPVSTPTLPPTADFVWRTEAALQQVHPLTDTQYTVRRLTHRAPRTPTLGIKETP
jgi:hypothetical protein